MAYATPADLCSRYDVRRLGELVRDDGSRLSASELDADDVCLAALADASAILDSAALTGARYSQDDLIALAADATGGPFLIRLVCNIAYGLLVARRGMPAADLAQLAPLYADALKTLDSLRSGDRVFEIASALTASKPVNVKLSSSVTLITEGAVRLFGQINNEDTPRY